MIQLNQFVKNIRKLDLMKEVKFIAEKHRFFLSDAVLQEWQQGKSGAGIPLSVIWTGKSAYSASWGKKRQARGLQISYIDLRFSGELADNLRSYINKSGNTVTIDIKASTPATQEKESDLNKLFGNIGGVTEETAQKFADIIKPELVEVINKKLFTE